MFLWNFLEEELNGGRDYSVGIKISSASEPWLEKELKEVGATSLVLKSALFLGHLWRKK